MRLDKLVWAVRLYKTRSIASKACTADKVKLNAAVAKPGKAVAIGDEIAIKVNPIWRTFKLLDVPKSRVGAKLVPQFILETTSKEDLLQLDHHRLINSRQKALGIKGRPTKKDRRELNRLSGK